MRADRTRAVALHVPEPGRWDFGDYPYAVEPLTLPHPRRSWAEHDGDGGSEADDKVLRSLEALTDDWRSITVSRVHEDGLETLFWFRWMVGHHISFLIWRMMGDLLGRPSDGRHEAQRSDDLRVLVRAYSAALLYTASSTRPVYNEVIRPSMYRIHSTFSGTWAFDFDQVRTLLRGKRLPPGLESLAPEVVDEITLCHQIHLGVAQKLVPDGRSLLQHLVDHPVAHQPRVWGSLFDCYFLTVREDIAADDACAQLLRRVQAVVADVNSNGLFPVVADYPETVPEELATTPALRCQDDIREIFVSVTHVAARLWLDDRASKRVSS